MANTYEAVGKIHRIMDTQQVKDTFRKREFVIEMQDGNYPQHIKFQVTQDRSALEIRGELVFTSFDTDSGDEYERFGTRPAGRFVSRCQIPADFFNEGQYILGVNASTFRVKRYFQDEHALTFSVDSMGAPGKQWPEVRLGTIRPRLNWMIEEQLG